MSDDLIRTACVVRYPYPLAREAQHGETEGRRERPVAVGVRVLGPDVDLVLLFPNATKQPEASRFAVEVPAIEKPLPGSTPTANFGSSSRNSTPTLSAIHSILNPTRRSAASARRFSCRFCVSSSPAASSPLRSVGSADLPLAIAPAALDPLQPPEGSFRGLCFVERVDPTLVPIRRQLRMSDPP
jgi:hypothetical protein